MRIRQFVFVAIIAIATLAIAIVTASNILIARFDAIEAQAASDKALQALQALQADLNQLAVSARDYAEWDDAHDYARHPDPEFIHANFSFDSLSGMQVDEVALLDANGAALFAGHVNETAHTLDAGLSPGLLNTVRALQPRVQALRRERASARVLATPQGLMAFSMVEICLSNRTDCTGAMLFFGRRFEADELQRVRETSQLPVMLSVASAGKPLGTSTFALVDDQHITGFAPVKDWNGNTLAAVSVTTDRHIGLLGRRTTALLMGIIAALVLACMGAFALLLNRLRQHWEQRLAAEQSAREHEQHLAHIAEHDPLTGLPNRRHLQVRVAPMLERAAADAGGVALLYLGLDQFGQVNDSRGHSFGDEILKIVGARLRNGTAADYIVVRMGGDEFVIVATAHGKQPDVRELGQRLLNMVRAPIVCNETTLSLTASIGVAIGPQDGSDFETLLKHADIALHSAKARCRSGYQLFTNDMDVELRERVLLEQALRRAIGTEQIRIEYQPLVDLRTGMLVSFEALARWHHPEMGIISPGRFIPVAESSDLIVGLSEQIVRDVLAQLRAWQQEGLTLAPVAINVSPTHLERCEFANYVHEKALEYDIDPHWLSFEVTESAWLENSSKHVVAIDTLRHAGSRVYIDDFGTGFSNLNYLKSLPIDAIKIDQSFVRHIATDNKDAMIVRSLIAVAQELNLDTVAEGIETQEQAAQLIELGCKYAQGYLFGRPQPALKARSLLLERRLAHVPSEGNAAKAPKAASG